MTMTASWFELARCRRVDPIDFYPDPDAAAAALPAQAVCARCPVRLPCAEHALTKPEPLGVWGGLTERERRRIRRRKSA